MFSSVKRVVEPAIEPVSLEELRLHLRLDTEDIDTLLSLYISAARDVIERYVRRQLLTASFELWCPSFAQKITLPYPPLQSVDTIIYLDLTGAETVLNATTYVVNTIATPGEMTLALNATIPSTQLTFGSDAVRIFYTAGYGAKASDVPAPLRAAVLLCAADLFENPTAQVDQRLQENKTLCSLLYSYRLIEAA
jgi:uncharacterized phiE125 gp8 family phage protein